MAPAEEQRERKYPFSAIVGQENLRTALLLNAVDPAIGGVLIRGEKGTGKTTAARALTEILPPIEAVAGCPYHCEPEDGSTPHRECRRLFTEGGAYKIELLQPPFVELPLNASEDRVAGTIHFEETLASGTRVFEPGLLASAHRGILYVDEVNLLEDHLVDILLDAAATGRNRVEREGISELHPARFFLIGTMNPEEGELRPQFLDRFGLCVSVSGIGDAARRREITERRIAFENDPEGFLSRYREQDERLTAHIEKARKALPLFSGGQGRIEEAAWETAALLAARSRVQGHRADIVLIRAAAAYAALLARERVGPSEVFAVASFALLHRASGNPEDSPETMADRIRAILEEVQEGENAGSSEEAAKGEVESYALFGEAAGEEELAMSDMQIPGSAAAGSILFDFLDKKKALP
jgi:magnesium chelatase subunit I